MRRLAIALSLVFVSGGSLASAQTVIVTHAPAGGAVEVVFDNERVANGTADQAGQVTLTFALPAQLAQADVHVSTERCGETRRVLLIERGVTAPPANGACDHRDFPDVYVVQRVTTFVVDFTNAVPSVHLRQGPVPPSWLSDAGGATSTRARLPPAPKGLMVSGAIGLADASGWSGVACGTNTTTCSSTSVTRTLAATASFWITPNIGAEATYMRPRDVAANGSGDGYNFSSTRKTDAALLGGVVGGAIGGVRLYGRGGASYHRATQSTTETIGTSGTQNFELKTAGWSWYAGGGIEVWLRSFLALYADATVAQLRGSALGGAEGSMDDQLIVATGGVRLHLWK